MNKKIQLCLLCLLGILLLNVSCANVQQIDRGRLARRTMQIKPMPHQEAFIEEVHAIREGAAGGTGEGAGGGCGCN